jgi:hypothetical protein
MSGRAVPYGLLYGRAGGPAVYPKGGRTDASTVVETRWRTKALIPDSRDKVGCIHPKHISLAHKSRTRTGIVTNLALPSVARWEPHLNEDL